MSGIDDTQQAELRARLQAQAAKENGLKAQNGKLALSSRAPASAALRILPLVIIALVALLSFKTIGIVNNGGYAFPFGDSAQPHPFSNFGNLVSGWRPTNADPIVTGALGAKKEEPKDETAQEPAGEKVAEAAAADGPKPAQPAAAPDASANPAATDPTSPAAGAPAMANATPAAPLSETERALMMRLQERRETLDKRAQEMDIREGLLEAAEKRLEDRIKDLRRAEEGAGEVPELAASCNAAAPVPGQPAAAPRRGEPRQAIRNLVTMYESMRAKDAARVFESLDQPVLIEVVKQMNPRKMAEIMAAMSPQAAARLTVAIAAETHAKPIPQGDDLTVLPAGELPRLPAATAPPANAQGSP